MALGLNIKQKFGGGRWAITMLAVAALVAQPMYGFIAGQVASATQLPPVDKSRISEGTTRVSDTGFAKDSGQVTLTQNYVLGSDNYITGQAKKDLNNQEPAPGFAGRGYHEVIVEKPEKSVTHVKFDWLSSIVELGTNMTLEQGIRPYIPVAAGPTGPQGNSDNWMLVGDPNYNLNISWYTGPTADEHYSTEKLRISVVNETTPLTTPAEYQSTVFDQISDLRPGHNWWMVTYKNLVPNQTEQIIWKRTNNTVVEVPHSNTTELYLNATEAPAGTVEVYYLQSDVWYQTVAEYDTAGNLFKVNSEVIPGYVDEAAPSTTLNTPEGVVGKKFTVGGEASDNQALSRVYVQLRHKETGKRYGGTTQHLGGKQAASWSIPYDATSLNLPEGTYEAHVEVKDVTGNSTSVGWLGRFTLDTTPPKQVTLQSPSNGEYVSGVDGVEFTWKGNDFDIQAYRIIISDSNGDRVGGSSVAAPASSYIFNGAVHGETYTWQVMAYDKAINYGPWSAKGTVTIDNNAPKVLDVSQVYETRENGRIAVTLTFDEQIVPESLGQGWHVVAGSNDLKYIKRYYSTKEHTVTFRDAAGNEGSETFTVDKSPPVVTISNAELTSDNTVTLWGSVVDENFSYYYCWLTRTTGGEVGSRGENCVTTWASDLKRSGNPATGSPTGTDVEVVLGTLDVTGLVDGEYVVRMGAVDRIGNRNTTETFNVTVDRSQFTDDDDTTTPAPAEPEESAENPEVTTPRTGGGNDNSSRSPAGGNSSAGPSVPGAQFGGSTFSPLANTGGPLLALSSPLGNSADEEEEEEEEDVAVLGEEDRIAQVAGDNTTTGNTEDADDEGCGSFLGLCWYWWALIVAVLVTVAVLVRNAASSNESSDPTRRP